MKKNFTFTAIIKAIASSAAIAAITLITSCEREQPSGFQRNDGGVTLYATLEQPADTKTALQADGSVLWEPSEEIAVFSGSKSAKYTSTNDGPAAEAHFTPEDKSFTLGNDVWALYPYDEEATFADGVITTTIPADQTACEGTFARGANVTVAHSTTADLKFYNVCGGVRFSVTEEGINKVIFEGLDGEVIAGKVQIALDESGLPYVKDVLDGRLFITLTPPSGSTFEPGRWYYLSALPGALENGFKLRFYKDETYAKFISDKSVTVKRSVFGSLASADAAAAYESIVTHFPETEEAISNAENTVEDIAPLTKKIIDIVKEESPDNETDPSILSDEFLKIEGVVSSEISDDKNVIILKTQDNLFVNVILDDDSNGIEAMPNSQKKKSAELSINSLPLRTGVRQALLLSPCEKAEGGVMNINAIESYLSSIDYTTMPYVDKQVTLEQCTGDNLAKYGLVLFCGHGAANCSVMDGTYRLTTMSTGQEISELDNKSEFYKKYKDKLAYAIRDGETKLFITSKWLEATTTNPSSLKGLIIFAGACQSYKNNDLADFFINNGAAFLGNTKLTAVSFAGINAEKLTLSLSMGLGFNKSVDFIKDENFFNKFWHFFFGNIGYDDPDILQGGCNEDVYLIDPRPKELTSDVDEDVVTLSWSQCANTGDYSFDIYIDDVKIGSTTEHSVRVQAHSAKESHWYIIANLIVGGDIIASYKSSTEYFTVTGQQQEEETELNSRTYGGKKYSIVRKNVNTGSRRVNGDGSEFFECSYSVKVGRTTYDIPGTFYSYQTHRDGNDLGPALAVNQSTGDMWLFILEKDVDNYYGMCGYVYKISNGSISKTTVFDMANFGWFPFFNHEEGRLALNSFSYAGYYSLICFEDEDWSLYGWYDIYPDDFKDIQAQNQMIYIF